LSNTSIHIHVKLTDDTTCSVNAVIQLMGPSGDI